MSIDLGESMWMHIDIYLPDIVTKMWIATWIFRNQTFHRWVGEEMLVPIMSGPSTCWERV